MTAHAPRARVIRWALFVVTAASLFTLAWLRFSSVHQRTFDLALYGRMAWGFAHLDFWSPVVNAPALSVHLSLVMLPLAALGALFGYVPVLLGAQALSAAACLFPLWRIAERRVGPRSGYLGAALPLLYPNLWHVTTYEFHPSNLAVLPLCWMADALDRNDARALLGWGALTVACREDLGLVVGLYGAAMWWRSGRQKGAATAGVGAAALAAGLLIVRMQQSAGGASLDQHFGAWGGTPLGIVPALLHDPQRVLDHLLAPRTLAYVPMLLAPLWLLPLGGGALLLPAAGPVALNLISTFPTTTHFYSHYLTPALPALWSAALVGLGRVQPWLPDARVGHALLLLALASAHGLRGGSPLSADFVAADYREGARTRASHAVLRQIPAGDSVQAPDPLLPHLVARRQLHRGPPPEVGARWVVLDLRHRQRTAHTETLLRMSEEPLARSWLAREDHTAVLYASPWLLLERRPFDRSAAALAPYYRALPSLSRHPPRELCRCLEVSGAHAGDGELTLELRALGPCPSDLAVRLGPAHPDAPERPGRVDLLFDGVLSPAHLRRGDRLRSPHPVSAATLQYMRTHGVWVGALRSSGARPEPQDPVSVRVPVTAGHHGR